MKKFLLIFAFAFAVLSLVSCNDFLKDNDELSKAIYSGDDIVVKGDAKQFEGVKFASKTVRYDAKEHQLAATHVPQGANVEYINNGPFVARGDYKVTAIISYPGYETLTLEAVLSIQGPYTPGQISDELMNESSEKIANWQKYNTSVFDSLMDQLTAILESAEVQQDLFAELDTKLDEEMVIMLDDYVVRRIRYYDANTEETYNDFMEIDNYYNDFRVWYTWYTAAIVDSPYKDYFYGDMTEEEIQEYLGAVYQDATMAEYEKQLTELQQEGQQNWATISNQNQLFVQEIYLLQEIVQVASEYAEYLGYDNYLDYKYEQFGRDYTPDDMYEFCENVRTYIVPLITVDFMKKLNYTSYFQEIDAYNFRYKGVDDLEIVDYFMDAMGPKMEELYEHFWTDGYYSFSSNEESLGTATTFNLKSVKDSALSFSSNYQSMFTFVHEFGHYYCNTNAHVSFSQDVDEITSQGLEALLYAYIMKNYVNDENPLSDDYEMFVKYDLVNAIYLTCLVAQTTEVEIWAHTHPTATVNELYSAIVNILSSYGGWYDLTYWSYGATCSIGYYPSYMTSALSEIELYCMALNDWDAAAQTYLRFYEFNPTINCTDDELLEFVGLHPFTSVELFQYIAENFDLNK